MGLSTYENVALVETRKGGGIEIVTAVDRLGLVELLLNRGSIARGGTGGYGSEEHKAAPVEVEQFIAKARAMFAANEEMKRFAGQAKNMQSFGFCDCCGESKPVREIITDAGAFGMCMCAECLDYSASEMRAEENQKS